AEPTRTHGTPVRPRASAGDPQLAGQRHRRAVAVADAGGRCVTTAIRTLVVDDEKLARDRLNGFLSTLGGVEVVGQATNGLEAVEMIEEKHPDLVFLDVQMPGM